MGYYLLNNSCVTSCGNPTSFLRYADNITSVCQLCTGNCLTCINATACMSCVDNTFYLYTDTLACKLACPLYGGYVNSTLGTQLVCLPCADPFCLHCTSTVYGSCTQCNNISTLNNGLLWNKNDFNLKLEFSFNKVKFLLEKLNLTAVIHMFFSHKRKTPIHCIT